jgi:hypothetical protein
MPEDRGYPAGRKQSSVEVVNPMPEKKTSTKRRGVRRPTKG